MQKPEGSYISYFSNLVKLKGGINLAQGIPGFQPPKELKESLLSIVDKDIHQYAPGIGNFDLIKTLNDFYSRRFELDAENFLIVQGATEAISLIYTYLFRKLSEDFTALSFEPAYESYSQLPKIFGHKYIDYQLNEKFSFCRDELKETILANNVKIVFVSSPGNPFGKIWSNDEMDQLVSMANELNFYLIFDGVYKDLFFEKEPFIPLHSISRNVFYVNSFSKMLCITGWRIGYLYSHSDHRKGLRSIHDYIGLSAPSVLQEALVIYLRDNNFGKAFVHQFREDVKRNFNYLSENLANLSFMIPPIDGGCFIWAKLPAEFDSGFEFAYQLYQNKGVAIIPGEHFSKNHSSWVRLNIARPFHEIDEATKRIANFIEKG